MSLAQAIEAYHDLLSDDLAAASQVLLDDQQRRRGLFFGSRPLCTVLRPRFMTPGQYGFLLDRTRLVLRAFGKAHRAALADAAFRAQFGLHDWEEQLLQDDPRFRDPSPTSRLDAFYVADGPSPSLYFVENNAEVPTGTAYNDALTDAFVCLPVMRAFMRRFAVQPLPAQHTVLQVLLDAFEQFRGRREPPRIAIVDWREVPTYSEFVLLQAYFHSQGYECVIADPREMEYRDGRLMAGDTHVTLVYKRVLISELILRGGMEQPLVRAVREGAACMVNPFRCKLLHKKASLAVLSDERNAGLFSAEEREAIRQHIPWTRRVEDRKTEFGRRTVDLLELIAEQRERFVLKANDEYGGAGVLLGWQTEPEAWSAAVRAALAEPYIVQERVPIPREPYPSLIDGRVQIIDRLTDTDPFISYGEYAEGCLTRISTEALVNVTAGGGSTVPTFLVHER